MNCTVKTVSVSYTHLDVYKRQAFTLGVGTATTRWTAIDALSHSVEGILSKQGDPMITAIALSGIQAFSRCRKALALGTFSYEDRESLMYCSLLGGLVLAHTSTTAVHAMGYSLTYYKGIPHGRANGICLGDVYKRQAWYREYLAASFWFSATASSRSSIMESGL